MYNTLNMMNIEYISNMHNTTNVRNVQNMLNTGNVPNVQSMEWKKNVGNVVECLQPSHYSNTHPLITCTCSYTAQLANLVHVGIVGSIAGAWGHQCCSGCRVRNWRDVSPIKGSSALHPCAALRGMAAATRSPLLLRGCAGAAAYNVTAHPPPPGLNRNGIIHG